MSTNFRGLSRRHFIGSLLATSVAGHALTRGARADDDDDDPLPSWANGKSKQSILDFVARVTDEEGKDFVDEENRIAVFDPSMREQVATLAVAGAERILKREIDAQKHADLLAGLKAELR